MKREDPGIQWVRKVRHEISEECGHDPDRLIDYIMKMQERHKDQLVIIQEEPPKERVAAG